MSLNPGLRVGPYEIVAPLGEGGMGQVYRARDTRLGRTVALKLLPESLAGDEALRERFRREGEAIAAVNHPHICALYDIDRHDHHDVLVMEFVEGETLAAVLSRSRLPLRQALTYALEIAQALDTAHRAGIVHRDLKPGNVMITKNGAKLMDFGIAKLRPGSNRDEATRAATLTHDGQVVGTLNYMAPEQLHGGELDPRVDLFAFGALLYEMLTGRPAYKAPTDLIVEAPAPIQLLVRRCLERDPDTRWHSAHDAAVLIKATIDEPAPGVPARRRPPRLLTAAAILVAFALGAGLTWIFAARATVPARVSRLSIVAPPGVVFTPLDVSGAPQFALSPDGGRLAFVAGRRGEKPRVWVQSLESGVARALEGTEDGAAPFWSPDGTRLAFFTLGKLKTIDLTGGRVQDLADVTFDVLGGSWGPNGIVYAGSDGDAIHYLPSTGGPPRRVTTLDAAGQHTAHRRPQFLADGRRFIYFVASDNANVTGVYLASIDEPGARFIMQADTQAQFVPPDWLFFERGEVLVAQHLNLTSGELTGDPITLPDRVTALPGPSALMVSGSQAETLAYWNGGLSMSSLEWCDRSGRPVGPLVPGKARFISPTVSPSGQQVLVTRRAALSEPTAVWSVDTVSGRSTRLTFQDGLSARGVWSPDGTRIAYGLMVEGKARLFTKPASGAGADEALPVPPGRHYAFFPTDWSPDGDRILYQGTSAQGWDIWAWHLSGKTSHPVIEAPGNQTNGRVSPNGRWLAYASDDSGTLQVYVRPFLAGAGQWQVSERSGSQPVWRADGKELFFIQDDGLVVAATVREGAALEIVERRPLFRANVPPPLAPFPASFSVTPDGQRFLLNVPDDEPTSPITIIVNWTQALERR